MPSSRRHLLKLLAGTVAVGGFVGLAGCSSSCPDTGRPTPDETVAIVDEPQGPFETVPAGDWTGFAGDVGNTGYAASPIAEDIPSVRWRVDLELPETDSGGLSASAPTVGSELVVVADERRVHARSLRTGESRWTSAPVSPTLDDAYREYRANTVAPALGPNGDVYVGATDGLVALDGDDGSVRWKVDGIKDVGTPAVVDETVFALGGNELVAATLGGDVRWRRAVRDGAPPTSPAVGGGRVVYPTYSGVSAVEMDDGRDAWNRELWAESPAVIDGSTCIVGTDDGLHAIDVASGESLWSFSRGNHRALVSPVVTPETIYVVEQPGEAGAATFALDREDGKPTPRWCSDIGSGGLTAATDDLALAILPLATGPDAAQSIVAFTADLGAAPWAIEGGSHPAEWVTPPALVDGAIVVTTRGGTVVAFGGAP